MDADSREYMEDLIEAHDYRGIRDQDGWETLTLTVRANHDAGVADAILGILKND